jgi:hypothetical protein
MSDPTDAPRRQRLAEINPTPGSREAREAEYGQVWDMELSDVFRQLCVIFILRWERPQGLEIPRSSETP